MQDTTARRQSVVLKAGDRAVLSRGHNIAAEHGADTAAALAWTQGRVRFDNASVSHVRTELRRWYGIELDVSDTALANRHVTASFGAEPVGQVVHIIALTLGASVDQHGDTMVLKALPGGAPRR
jgi:transmembrane sensor